MRPRGPLLETSPEAPCGRRRALGCCCWAKDAFLESSLVTAGTAAGWMEHEGCRARYWGGGGGKAIYVAGKLILPGEGSRDLIAHRSSNAVVVTSPQHEHRGKHL